MIIMIFYPFYVPESYLLAYFSYFEKIKIGIWNHLAVWVSMYPPHQHLNVWTNLYETWYMYHATWANLSGLFHKCLPSVSVYMCVSFVSLLGKGSVKRSAPFVARQRLIKGESVDLCMYPLIVARQRFGKHSPVAPKSRWKHCFLCNLCGIKGK
jgi:hypothetical protein